MKFYFCYFILFYCALNADAQNLVSNSSFENIDKFEKFLDWQRIDCGSSCTCGYNKNEMDLLLKSNIDGNIAAQLNYIPICNGEGGTGEFIGCASCMQQKFKTPLEIGTCYKISYWVYCPDNRAKMHKDAYKHLGVMLSSYQMERNKNNTIFEKNVLTQPDDTLKINVWIKKENYVIPTCEINYLCIGVFKEEFWKDTASVGLRDDYKLTYFIDKVSVEKVNLGKTEIENLNATYYCNYLDKDREYPKNEKKEFTFYFDRQSEEISNLTALDSFAEYATTKKNQIFFVSGHTDNTGSNNSELSKNRANSVVKYLTEKYNLQKFRFITGYSGASKPVQSNDTEQGKAANRRVTIKEINVQKVNACYREGLKDIEQKNYDHAFNMLNCWLTDEDDGDKILTYFDPHLDVLKKLPKWKDIDKQVRKTYKKFKKPVYAFYLDSIYTEDQRHRRLSPYIDDLSGYVKEIDTARWDFPSVSEVQWMKEDSLLYVQILKFIDKNGFQKIGDVGGRAARCVPVVLVHGQKIEDLKKYLPLMEPYCKIGEAEWVYYAVMFDRICILEKKPQRYGTQYVVSKENPDIMIRYKCESLEIVNDWRRKIALSPISEEEFNITTKSK